MKNSELQIGKTYQRTEDKNDPYYNDTYTVKAITDNKVYGEWSDMPGELLGFPLNNKPFVSGDPNDWYEV